MREMSQHLMAPSTSSEPAPREPTAEEEAAREAAMERAVTTALRHERRFLGQQVQARRALQALQQGGPEALQGLHHGTGDLARMEALLARSWELRHEDPALMVQFAWLAVQSSLNLDSRHYDGPERIFDFQARAYIELGNACRAADRLPEAEAALVRARQLVELGTRESFLEIRLLEIEASLAADCREFGRAAENLLKVIKFYSCQGDDHRVGRAFVKLGLYEGYAGRLEKGVRLLENSMLFLDAQRDPDLAGAAVHNLLLFLIDSGHFQEASKLRRLHARYLMNPRGHINEVKFRALEGRIEAGFGDHGRAESIFREVEAGYAEAGLFIQAGVTLLDLAAALLAQGKAGEAAAVVLEAAATFVRLDIKREAQLAVVLLRNAFDVQAVTLAMIQEVAGFLRQLEIDPALRFEGRAWESLEE
jgi:hypothetical protein